MCTITAWNLLPEEVAEAKKYRWVHDGIREMHEREVHWWLFKLMVWKQPGAEEVLLIAGRTNQEMSCSFSHCRWPLLEIRCWNRLSFARFNAGKTLSAKHKPCLCLLSCTDIS